MKNVLTKFLALCSMTLLLLPSCKKDGTLVTSNGGKAGALTASATTLPLDKTKLNDTTTVIKFNFTAANYGYSAAVTNTLQIDSAGDNWKNPTSVIISNKVYSQGYSTAVFNNLVLKLNLPAGIASQIQVRVAHSISANVTPVYSNVVTLTVTPFNLISYVYVPGSYQNTNSTLQWQPTTADSLVSPTGNGVYTGYVYFQAGSIFKITPAKNWNNSYGDAGGGKISLSAGGNLTAPSAGLYLVTVNTNAGTITYTAYNHTWSLIGSAGVDWNTDIQMPFNQNNNAYQATYALNSSGQFKFRADNAWTLSLGDVTPVTGQLTSNNGANINVPSNGTYLVSLSFGNPLLAPTYTLVKQ
ncbi:MAG: SusE outer membrane protein [Mucilaginibacter sp.]|nr:SusE outer membrane protein [Mucilaginibacter sp.]